jgi:tRNA(fMet)-specific endonuclease VapC
VKYMLDTNTLIYFIKNKPPSVAARINALNEDDELCMSFVTYAELLKGAEGSSRKTEVLRRLEGPALCEHYASQATKLKLTGTLIGANDLWIASHALAQTATVVTNNLREFGRIEGLIVENWVE